MNNAAIASNLLAAISLTSISTAQAELLVAKGSKATLTVEYSYSSAGAKKDKYDPREWNVNRQIKITALFEAGKPQELAQMRAMEAGQLADLRNKQANAASAAKKMTPMMGDMMKIVERCGENEACIEKAVASYGNNMEITPDLQSAGQDIQKVGKTDGPRYQKWAFVSQKGTYAIDESYRGQTADPACMEKPGQRCSRAETRKGNGEFALPPGKNTAGTASFEVDAKNKDIVLLLPVPLAILNVRREVRSDFPDEASGVSTDVATANLAPGPITVAIPADLKNLSGSRQVKGSGAQGEGGTLTVRWTLTVH